jgi:hypothetical protein
LLGGSKQAGGGRSGWDIEKLFDIQFDVVLSEEMEASIRFLWPCNLACLELLEGNLLIFAESSVIEQQPSFIDQSLQTCHVRRAEEILPQSRKELPLLVANAPLLDVRRCV